MKPHDYLSVCAVFKHEEPYIGDWIKYHLNIGVGTFYLYDNESPDKSSDIAQDMGGSRVIMEMAKGEAIQHPIYMKCSQDHGHETRWMAFLDIDEFIVPLNNHLHDILKDFESYPALCAHWVLFGSNGHKHFEPMPVPERFTRSQQGADRHVKSFVNPSRTTGLVTAHRFYHDTNPVDENFRNIDMIDSRPDDATRDKIYIAHYATKSEQECAERRSRSRADMREIRHDKFFLEHDINEIENLDVYNVWRNV